MSWNRSTSVRLESCTYEWENRTSGWTRQSGRSFSKGPQLQKWQPEKPSCNRKFRRIGKIIKLTKISPLSLLGESVVQTKIENNQADVFLASSNQLATMSARAPTIVGNEKQLIRAFSNWKGLLHVRLRHKTLYLWFHHSAKKWKIRQKKARWITKLIMLVRKDQTKSSIMLLKWSCTKMWSTRKWAPVCARATLSVVLRILALSLDSLQAHRSENCGKMPAEVCHLCVSLKILEGQTALDNHRSRTLCHPSQWRTILVHGSLSSINGHPTIIFRNSLLPRASSHKQSEIWQLSD